MRYMNAELEIVKFLAKDIIATSTTGDEDEVIGGGMGGDSEGEPDPI